MPPHIPFISLESHWLLGVTFQIFSQWFLPSSPPTAIPINRPLSQIVISLSTALGAWCSHDTYGKERRNGEKRVWEEREQREGEGEEKRGREETTGQDRTGQEKKKPNYMSPTKNELYSFREQESSSCPSSWVICIRSFYECRILDQTNKQKYRGDDYICMLICSKPLNCTLQQGAVHSMWVIFP